MTESQVEEHNPFDAFDGDVRLDVDGLIWLGHLEESFSFCGHTFVIRTLRGDEELLAGLVMKDYIETMGQAKAHVWATVALAVIAIDGADDFCPQATPDNRSYARARFQWVTGNWYWPTALFIYNKYAELLQRQQEATDALDSFCSGSLPPDMPFADSWTGRASSTPPPTEDIREYLGDPDPSTPSS